MKTPFISPLRQRKKFLLFFPLPGLHSAFKLKMFFFPTKGNKDSKKTKILTSTKEFLFVFLRQGSFYL